MKIVFEEIADAQQPFTPQTPGADAVRPCVFVDGIDRQKASELTNALRVRGVSLDKVRSRRDESEPMIRLADMWAGCIRAAREGSQEEAKMLDAALNLRCVWSLLGLPQKRKTP